MIPESLRAVVRRATARAVISDPQDGTITKRFHDPELARRELGWYLRLEHLQVAPRLLDYTRDSLILEHCPTAEDLGADAWHPYQELHATLFHLAWDHGVHHRDVHARNVVRLPGGRPGLIDWETAVYAPQLPPYDLVGPHPHIARPDIHRARYVMHWHAEHPLAMGRFWSGFEEC